VGRSPPAIARIASSRPNDATTAASVDGRQQAAPLARVAAWLPHLSNHDVAEIDAEIRAALADRQRDAMTELPVLAPKTAAAYHEAGHAVATMLAFRTARLPMRPPERIIKYIEITVEGSNAQWDGLCFGPNIYAVQWPEARIDWIYREAMEWQIMIDLAGGIAEAISRGERRKKKVFWFAVFNCGCRDDLKTAAAVVADLRKLTGRQHGERRFGERVFALLLAYWAAVDALASALVDAERIEGDQIEKIVEPWLGRAGARSRREPQSVSRQRRGH
jgi:hypothetical protein